MVKASYAPLLLALLLLACGHRHIDEKQRVRLADERSDDGQAADFYASLQRQDPRYLGYTDKSGPAVFSFYFGLNDMNGGRFATTFAVEPGGSVDSLSGKSDFTGTATCQAPAGVSGMGDCREIDFKLDFKVDRGPDRDPQPIQLKVHFTTLADYELFGQVGDGPSALWGRGHTEVVSYESLGKRTSEERLFFARAGDAGPAFSEPRPILPAGRKYPSFSLRVPLPLTGPNGQIIFVEGSGQIEKASGEISITSLPDVVKIPYRSLESTPEPGDSTIKLTFKKMEEKK